MKLNNSFDDFVVIFILTLLFIMFYTCLSYGKVGPDDSGDYFPKSGDIILTRNEAGLKDGRPSNGTPGYWNHAAIIAVAVQNAGTEGAYVIEVQKAFPEVVAFKMNNFLDRYPEYVILRPRPGIGFKAADKAFDSVSEPTKYAVAASVHLKIKDPFIDRENCVSLVRRCYLQATHKDFGWRRPDHIWLWRDRQGFSVVASKKDLTWREPKEKWAGMLTK